MTIGRLTGATISNFPWRNEVVQCEDAFVKAKPLRQTRSQQESIWWRLRLDCLASLSARFVTKCRLTADVYGFLASHELIAVGCGVRVPNPKYSRLIFISIVPSEKNS